MDSTEQRLARIESELAALRSITLSEHRPAAPAVPLVSLKVHFGRIALERKPYSVTVAGKTSSLTAIRTAVLLTLLMDLQERSERGNATYDTLERARSLLVRITPGDEQEKSDDAIRMAFHRADQFLKEEFGDAGELSFTVRKGQLQISSNGRLLHPAEVSVDITTTDQVLSSFLDQSLATSPLSRLRKSGALFVPGGSEGQDRLSLELLDHDFPTKQVCLFYRPTIQSFPPELLHKLQVSDRRRQRQQVAMQRYQRGNLAYCEILQRKALWSLAERQPGKGFKNYPRGVTVADVVQQLDHLQFLVRSQSSYELVLTDAFTPFYLTTFEITKPEGVERYVLFFQQQEEESLRQISVFALTNDAVFFSSQESIIRWILSHPTTVRDREQVLREIQAVRDAVVSSMETGPLPVYSSVGIRSAESHSPLTQQLEVIHEAKKGEPGMPVRSEDGSRANREGSSE